MKYPFQINDTNNRAWHEVANNSDVPSGSTIIGDTECPCKL